MCLIVISSIDLIVSTDRASEKKILHGINSNIIPWSTLWYIVTTRRRSVNTWRTQDFDSAWSSDRRHSSFGKIGEFGSDARRVTVKKRLSSIGRSDPRQQTVCSPSVFRIHPLTVSVASARESFDSCKYDARKLMMRDDLSSHLE